MKNPSSTLATLLCICLLVIPEIVAFAQNDTPPREESSQRDTRTGFDPVFRDSTRDTWHATLTDNDVGLWFCAWSERTPRGSSIRGAFLSHGQREDIRSFAVSDPVGAEDERPAAAFLRDSSVLVVWQHRSAGHHSLQACIVWNSGRRSDVFRVSESEAGCIMPAAGRNSSGEVLLAWQDYRNGNADIFAQRYDGDARPLGHNLMLNDDSSTAMQGAPRIAADNRDAFLVVWPDNREDGAWKFYYQLVASEKQHNVLIDSAQRKAMTTVISAVMTPGDSAVFAWKDYRSGDSNIFRRLADLSSGSLSPVQRINDDDGDRWQRLAVVDGDGAGQVVVCWEDYRNTEINQRGDIYLQPFSRSGQKIGPNIKVNDRDERIARKMPAIAMDAEGRQLVIWHQGEDGSFRLMGQWLQFPASREGGNFCITCGSCEEVE
jgi:hypothetical protein